MKSKIYTKKEIELLKVNPFVLSVDNSRFIKYDPLFKLWCIIQRQKHPELTCKEIFAIAGFNVTIMNLKLPQSRIKDWENVFYRFGYSYFVDKNSYCKIKNELIDSKWNCKNNSEIKLSIYKEVLNVLEEKYGRHTYKN